MWTEAAMVVRYSRTILKLSKKYNLNRNSIGGMVAATAKLKPAFTAACLADRRLGKESMEASLNYRSQQYTLKIRPKMEFLDEG